MHKLLTRTSVINLLRQNPVSRKWVLELSVLSTINEVGQSGSLISFFISLSPLYPVSFSRVAMHQQELNASFHLWDTLMLQEDDVLLRFVNVF